MQRGMCNALQPCYRNSEEILELEPVIDEESRRLDIDTAADSGTSFCDSDTVSGSRSGVERLLSE
jgi:hypothetical protein